MKTFKQFLVENKFSNILIDLQDLQSCYKNGGLELQIFPENNMISFKTIKNEYFDFKFDSKTFKNVKYSLSKHFKYHNSQLNIESIKIVLNAYYGNKYKSNINKIIKDK